MKGREKNGRKMINQKEMKRRKKKKKGKVRKV